MDSIPIISQKGKVVAKLHVDPQGVKYTFKTIRCSEHMLRFPEPSFAYDDFVLSQAISLGASYHVIYDEESDISWCVWHSLLAAKGKKFNYGHGSQTRLALRFWELGTEPTPCQVIELYAPNQLELFGNDMEEAA